MSNEYIENIVYEYKSKSIEYEPNVSSTGIGLCVTFNNNYKVFIPDAPQAIMISELNEIQKNQGNIIEYKRTCSTHKDFLSDSKNKLVNLILEQKNPSQADKIMTINLSYMALRNQIDVENIPQNNQRLCSMYEKLLYLGLNQHICNKYNEINQILNASDHADKDNNIKIRNHLNTQEGVLTTIHCFEVIRRVFIELYSKKNVPDWDELKDINYILYGISYSFDTFTVPQF